MKEIIKKFWWFGYFIFLGIVCFWKIVLTPGLLCVADWGIPPDKSQLITFFNKYFSAWFYLGNLQGFPTNCIHAMSLPFYGFLALFGALGFSGVFVSKFILFLIFIAAGSSAYFLLKYFKFGDLAAIIGATIYLINPFTFDWLTLGGTNTLLFNYALIPWIVILVDQLFKEEHLNISKLIIFNLLLVPYPLHIVPLSFFIMVLYFIFYLIKSKDFKKVGGRFILILTVSGMLSLLFHSYWLSLLISIKESAGGLLFSLPSKLSFLTIIRLLNDYPGFFNRVISWNILTFLASFFLPVLALAGFFMGVKREQVKTWGYFTISVVFFIIFLQISHACEKNFLLLGVFRDYTKIYPLILIGYIILIANFWENFLKKYPKIFAVLILIVFIYYFYPFFTGDLKKCLETARFSPENSEVTRWLQTKKDNFKVLWLPQGGIISKEQNIKTSISDFYSALSPIPGEAFSMNYRHKLILSSWLNNLYYDKELTFSDLDKIIGLSSIKYLIMRNKLEIANWATANCGVWQRRTADIQKVLEKQKNFKIVKIFGDITVFENPNNLPLIFSPEKVYYTTQDLNLFVKLAKTSFNFSKNAFIFGTAVPNILPPENSFGNIWEPAQLENLDSLLPFIPPKFILNLADFCQYDSPQNHWINYHRYYPFYNQNYQAALEPIAFTLGPEAKLIVPHQIENDGQYLIFLKAYQGTGNSKLKIKIGGEKINIDLSSEKNEGFLWKKLGPFFIKGGKITITLESENENAVARLIIIPESEFAKFKKESESFFLKPQNEKLLLLGNNEIPLQLANNANLNLFLKSSERKYSIPDYFYIMDFKNPFYFQNLPDNFFEGTSPIEIYWQGFYKPETWKRILPSKKGYEKQLWRWMDQYGKIIIVNHYQTSLKVNLNFTTSTFKKNKTLIFWLNNKKLKKIQVPTKDKDFVINNVTLIPGINIIEIETKQNESFFDHGRTITVAFRSRPWIRKNPEKLSRLAVNPKNFNWISDKNFTAVFSNFKEGEYLWLGESIPLELNLENSLAKLKIALPEKNSAVIFVVFGIAEKNSQKPFQFIIKPLPIENKIGDPKKIIYYLNSPFILLEKKWDFKNELRNFFPNNKNLKIVSTHLLYFNYSDEQQGDHRPLFLLKDLTFFQENNSQKNILKPVFFQKLSQTSPRPVNSFQKQIKINLPDLPLEDAEIFLLNFLDFPAFFYKVTCQFDLFSSKNGENFYYEFIPDKETISESPDFKSIGFNLKNALLNKKDIKIRALTINIEKETPFVSNNKEFPPEIKIDSIIFGKSVDNLSWKEILANKILRNVPIISINGQELPLKETNSNNPFVPQVILKKLPAGDFYQIGKISNPFLDVPFLQVESPQQKIIEPVQLIFKKIDQTKYIIKVRTSRPYWLVFNETFDKNWVLLKEPKPLKNHCIINGFANGWWVEETGDYELILEYLPEKFYKLGIAVSAISIILALIYLICAKLKTKKLPSL